MLFVARRSFIVQAKKSILKNIVLYLMLPKDYTRKYKTWLGETNTLTYTNLHPWGKAGSSNEQLWSNALFWKSRPENSIFIYLQMYFLLMISPYKFYFSAKKTIWWVVPCFVHDLYFVLLQLNHRHLTKVNC